VRGLICQRRSVISTLNIMAASSPDH